MSRRIVVAGAGGFGRGVYRWITTSPLHCREHGVDDIVFIDDGVAHHLLEAPLISSIAAYEPMDGDAVVCAIGSPSTRKDVVRRLQQKGAKFHTFVDDRATLSPDVIVGEGAIVCPGVVISANGALSEHVHVNFNCSIGHDAQLGPYVTLSPSVNVMGQVDLGEGAFLGGSAVILPRLTVGAGAVIGAGAVVVRDVDSGSVMTGNPARPRHTFESRRDS